MFREAPEAHQYCSLPSLLTPAHLCSTLSRMLSLLQSTMCCNSWTRGTRWVLCFCSELRPCIIYVDGAFFFKFYPLLLDNKDFESTCIVGVGSHEFKWRKSEGDIEGDLKQLKTTFTEAPNCFCQGRRMVYLCKAFVCA